MQRRRRDLAGDSMRFLPLADIFTAAMASVLLMIVIAQKANRNDKETAQAEHVFTCVANPAGRLSAGEAEGNDSLLRRLRPEAAAGPISFEGLAKELRSATSSKRLSARVQLVAAPGDRHCLRRFQKLIEDHNDAFNDKRDGTAPNIYLLAHVIQLPSGANGL